MKKNIVTSLLLCGLLNAETLSLICYRDNYKHVVICSEKKLGRLMWQDEKQIFKGTFEQASEYCRLVNLAGFEDWRLPTIEELSSITDVEKYNLTINSVFKHLPELEYLFYWSSTKYIKDLLYVWGVNFSDGNIGFNGSSDQYFVRCVRND